MNQPRIEIRYVEAGAPSRGYILVTIDGLSQPTIPFADFDTGNDAQIHMGLHALVEKVYTKGFADGERASKKRVTDLIEWASE